MRPSISYETRVHPVVAEDGRKVAVYNLIPKLSEKQRRETKKQINDALFHIFYKYMS